MRLRILTPLSIEVDEENVQSVQAEDASGSFGVLPHHADFLTSLAIAVVSWTRADGTRRHCAARHGVLTMTGGRELTIATREAVLSDDLLQLTTAVLDRMRSDIDLDRSQRVEDTRLQLGAIRQIMSRLRADKRQGFGGVS